MGETAPARWAYLLPGAHQTCMQASSRCAGLSYFVLYYFPSAADSLGKTFADERNVSTKTLLQRSTKLAGYCFRQASGLDQAH